MTGGDEGAKGRVPVQAGAIDEVAPIVAAHGEVSQLAFGTIVVDRQTTIFEKTPKAVTLVEVVADRLLKRLTNVLADLLRGDPRIEQVEQGSSARCAPLC